MATDELDILADTTNEDTGLEDTTQSGDRLYDYTNQRETGERHNLYWNNYSRQLTEDELRAEFNSQDNGQLKKVFGSFDNYLAYMNERQDLIDSGELKADWWDTGVALIDPTSLGREGGMDDRKLENTIIHSGADKAKEAYDAQSDLLNSLYEKYTGNSGPHYNSDGDKFEWNGTSFVKTMKVDDHNTGPIALAIAGAIIAQPMAAGITAGLGVSGGVAAGAMNGAISSAISQGIVNGKIDPQSLVTAGILGGIGGLADDLMEGVIQPGTGLEIGSKIDNAVWDLSGTLGLSYEETLNILKGVATGAVQGNDIEGIVANAVAGFGQAKIMSSLRNMYGNTLDIDNWFKEGDANIPIEALNPIVSFALDSVFKDVDSVDALKAALDYFRKGGNLDFLVPGTSTIGSWLNSLDVDLNIDLPNLTCPEFLKNENGDCSFDVDLDCPEFLKNPTTGKCASYTGTGLTIDLWELGCQEGEEWNTELGKCVDIPDVNIPDVNVPNVDIQVCSDEQKANGGIEIKIGDPDSWYCQMPDTPDIEMCSDEELAQGGYTVRIGDPDSWYCKLPDVGCPQGEEFNTELGKCIPICPEGEEYNSELGQCVNITVGCSQGEEFNTELGKCIPICPEGEEYNSELDKCVDITVGCPQGEEFNTELGKCIPICPEGEEYNSELGQCVDITLGCQKGYEFNTELGKCIPICSENEEYNSELDKCVDIPDVGCPEGTQFNTELGRCIPICPSGQEYNSELDQCIDITLPCPPTKVRNEQTGECECPEGKVENSVGLCVDPDDTDACPEGQEKDPDTGECVDIETKVEEPKIDIDFGFTFPQQTTGDERGMFTGSGFLQDPQLLQRTQFPIRDFLAEALPKTKQNTGMMTGFKA